MAPVLYRERVLGTITAIKRPDEPDFVEEDVEHLQAMANQAAVAVENSRLYEAQTEQLQELQESNDALEAFSQMVAHDLKGPLTIMMGYAELIMENNVAISIPEPELSLYAEVILGTSQKMSNILNDLLLLARVRRSEEVPLMQLDMAWVVNEAMRRLGEKSEEVRAHIIRPEYWPVAVGYGQWVEEIWVNYISNALKYGGECPEIRLGYDEGHEGMVRFWVQDWGIGVSDVEQGQLFNEFKRVGERKIQGHGLGLSIVKRIAERMGGEVGVESEVGVGSRFWFTLPSGS